MMAMMSMARTRGPGGGRQDGKGDKARMRDDGSEGDEGDEGSVGAMGGFVIETSSALGRIIPDGACETNLTAAASTEMTDTHVVAVASVRAEVYRDGFDGSLAAACRVGNDVGSAISANVTFPRADCVISGGQFHCTPASDVAAALAETSAYARASGVASALGECHCAAGADVLSFVKATQQPKHYRVRPAGEASQEETAAACPAATASNRGGWCCCGGRDRLVRSLGATEGRRHGRGGGGRGAAGGREAGARRHLPTSGGRRRRADGEGWESHCAGPLRELCRMQLAGGCDSAAGGGDAEQRSSRALLGLLFLLRVILQLIITSF